MKNRKNKLKSKIKMIKKINKIIYFALSKDAFTNDANNGCALFGLDLNSGWN